MKPPGPKRIGQISCSHKFRSSNLDKQLTTKTRNLTKHLKVLWTILKSRKPLYLVFLDVTKAYDKAWLDGILYNLYNRGVTGPTWNMIRKLNLNLKAEIKTNHGLTRPIQIRDSIRQGGVLSVLLYAAIMDEISTETMKENLGIQIKNQNTKVGCMLWMDDVVLISDNREEMQELLNKTNEVANMYHLEFGKEKSKDDLQYN